MLLFVVFTTTIIIMHHNDYYVKNMLQLFLLNAISWLRGCWWRKITSYGNVSKI